MENSKYKLKIKNPNKRWWNILTRKYFNIYVEYTIKPDKKNKNTYICRFDTSLTGKQVAEIKHIIDNKENKYGKE